MELFTVEQVADQHNVHPNTIRKAIRDGRLVATRPGRDWLISPQDAAGYVEGKPGRPAKVGKPTQPPKVVTIQLPPPKVGRAPILKPSAKQTIRELTYDPSEE